MRFTAQEGAPNEEMGQLVDAVPSLFRGRDHERDGARVTIPRIDHLFHEELFLALLRDSYRFSESSINALLKYYQKNAHDKRHGQVVEDNYSMTLSECRLCAPLNSVSTSRE